MTPNLEWVIRVALWSDSACSECAADSLHRLIKEKPEWRDEVLRLLKEWAEQPWEARPSRVLDRLGKS